jgi:hypothetical protein
MLGDVTGISVFGAEQFGAAFVRRQIYELFDTLHVFISEAGRHATEALVPSLIYPYTRFSE